MVWWIVGPISPLLGEKCLSKLQQQLNSVKDFKPPDRTPHNYDQQPFHVGRMDLDISFLEKIMKTPVYVKMDDHEQLLLPEGVC